MYVQWKALIGLGLIFWILLCTTDILTGTNYNIVDTGYGYGKYYFDSFQDQKVEEVEEDTIGEMVSFVLWNIVTFGISFYFCSFIRKALNNLSKVYMYQQNEAIICQPAIDEFKQLTNRNSSSKIPILLSRSNTKLSDENILKKSENSCPDLIVTKVNCRTIFQNPRKNFDLNLENKCAKLREDMMQVQANAMKEQSILQRQLETATKEKKELTKQLASLSKENRGAKQQLEELLQEKCLLNQRLDSATMEFRNNTKTKKFALAKLEEVTCNVDNLKLQLEQTTRDKEILESKLNILQGEYEKLQERVILFQSNEPKCTHQEKPERDDNTSNTNIKKEVIEPMDISVSQTELDMQKVQMKIDILEENLKNFNLNSHVPNLKTISETENVLWRSDYSSNNEDGNETTDDMTETQDSSSDSPRNYWSYHNVPTKLMGTDVSTINSSATISIDSTVEEVDGSSVKKRIVSSSVAFQRFLEKNLACDHLKYFGLTTTANTNTASE